MILPMCFIPERVKEPLPNVPMARHIDVPRAKENRNGSKSCHWNIKSVWTNMVIFLIAKNTWNLPMVGSWTLVMQPSVRIFTAQQLFKSRIGNNNSQKPQFPKKLYIHIFLQQTHIPQISSSTGWTQDWIPIWIPKTLETHICQICPTSTHKQPAKFKIVFQIWSPWCFFSTLVHLRIFWKRMCFFSDKKPAC